MASQKQLIKRIESLLTGVMAVDRLAARREIKRCLQANKKFHSKQNFEQRLDRLLKRLEKSEQKRNRRLENVPVLRFNEDLPIFAKKDEIIQAIADHQVIVISGETGSGKTTQLPKFCLAAGRGIDGVIGCTQPRRIAATTVARRVAEEIGQDAGQAVGYKIRFKDRTAKDAYIKFMTDGILLAETQSDRYLSAYDTIIVDEAHERSLNIDFILGILQTLLKKRADLKLIITSATIDTEKFSKAFNEAPVIEVSGRMYPVDVQYLTAADGQEQNGDQTHVELAAAAVGRLIKQTRTGDILVFMPSEQDIRETCDLIQAARPVGAQIMPLFARLTATEQSRVFARLSDRKIIVATNVAETSITIPGIKYVIDSGLARISRYSPRTRTTSLPVLPVSRSSADQRKGRCGRVENGVCIRIYSEDDYLSRPQFTPPEIIRANLAEVILRMIALGLGEIDEFPFIDRPDLKSIQDGFNLLFELGAITTRHRAVIRGQKPKTRGRKPDDSVLNSEFGIRNSERKINNSTQETETGNGVFGISDRKSYRQIRLTEQGRMMTGMPLDPRLSRMLLEADKEGCVAEIAVLAAALSIQDPRERPAEKTREADKMHKTFDDPDSDFVTLLNIWYRYHVHWHEVKSSNQMKRYCREHYLSFKRMREWRDIQSQIMAILAEQELGKSEVGMRNAEVRRRKAEDGMRKAEVERGKAEGGSRKAEVGIRNSEFGSWNAQGGRRISEGGVRILEEKKRKPVPGKQKENGGFSAAGNGSISDFRIPTSTFVSIHKSVLSGFLSNIAQKKEKNIFRAARGREVMIFPGSGLFDKANNWIVAAEVVETSRVFARTVANIDSGWLEDMGKDLCRYTYLNPCWERSRGEVVATEQVSLFGLIIAADRKVSYGKVNPDEACDIFIQSALINGDVKHPFAFMKHNQQLIGDVKDIENRLRRRDLLVSDQELFNFYKQRLAAIYDIRSLAGFLRQKGNDQLLRMKKEDLRRYDPEETKLAQFPDQVQLGGHRLPCAYNFEPGEDRDGVTVQIASAIAASIPAEAVDWLVPGLYPDKIEAYLKGLPKAYRKKLVPIKDTVEIICREMPRTQGSLISALGEFIYQRFQVDIPASAWSDAAMPDHLKMRLSITAPDGREMRSGRNAAILYQDLATGAKSDEFEALCQKWEKSAVTRWDFGELPDAVSLKGEQDTEWIAYPALEPDPADPKQVNLRLLQHRDKAIEAHRLGVATLYSIHFSKDLKFLQRQLSLPAGQRHLADYFGGAKRLEQRLHARVVQELFARNIRHPNAYYDHAAAIGPKILSSGQELLERVLPVLAAYYETRCEIVELQQAHRSNRTAVGVLQELIEELVRLVPENFVDIYPHERLVHLTRYCKALAIRARRAILDFEKDQTKLSEIKKFTAYLNTMLTELSPLATDEKRQAVEEYFWMIEEYKVSVFAQELKTAVPVSAKRLTEKLKQIERMI
jgi:ATP-dependent helicase HrpA